MLFRENFLLIRECVLGHCLLISSCCIVNLLLILFETSQMQKLFGKRTERFEVTTSLSAASNKICIRYDKKVFKLSYYNEYKSYLRLLMKK